MDIPEQGYESCRDRAARGDVLMPKKHPSAFFATALASHLIDLQAPIRWWSPAAPPAAACAAAWWTRFAFNFLFVAARAVYDRSASRTR